MALLSRILLVWSVATQAAFVIGAASVFDIRRVELRSRIFAVVFVVAVLTTLFTQAAYPRLDFSAQLAGALLLTVSAWLFYAAAAANRNKKLTAVHSSNLPEHLMVQGPYAYVRHPFYSAYIAAFAASALASAHLVPLFWTLVCFAHYYVAAKMEEEKFSRSALAEKYRGYRQSTGMFVPRFKLFGRTR